MKSGVQKPSDKLWELTASAAEKALQELKNVMPRGSYNASELTWFLKNNNPAVTLAFNKFVDSLSSSNEVDQELLKDMMFSIFKHNDWTVAHLLQEQLSKDWAQAYERILLKAAHSQEFYRVRLDLINFINHYPHRAILAPDFEQDDTTYQDTYQDEMRSLVSKAKQGGPWDPCGRDAEKAYQLFHFYVGFYDGRFSHTVPSFHQETNFLSAGQPEMDYSDAIISSVLSRPIKHYLTSPHVLRNRAQVLALFVNSISDLNLPPILLAIVAEYFLPTTPGLLACFKKVVDREEKIYQQALTCQSSFMGEEYTFFSQRRRYLQEVFARLNMTGQQAELKRAPRNLSMDEVREYCEKIFNFLGIAVRISWAKGEKNPSAKMRIYFDENDIYFFLNDLISGADNAPGIYLKDFCISPKKVLDGTYGHHCIIKIVRVVLADTLKSEKSEHFMVTPLTNLLSNPILLSGPLDQHAENSIANDIACIDKLLVKMDEVSTKPPQSVVTTSSDGEEKSADSANKTNSVFQSMTDSRAATSSSASSSAERLASERAAQLYSRDGVGLMFNSNVQTIQRTPANDDHPLLARRAGHK